MEFVLGESDNQKGMSERVGIDRSFLADVEQGKRNVSILNLDLMAKGLKVAFSQLFFPALAEKRRVG